MLTRILKPFAAIMPMLFVFSLIAAGPITDAKAQAAAPVPVHKNWVQRHPTATGIGAAIATHHALKVAAAKRKKRGQKLNWAERHPTLSAIGVGAATTHVIKKSTH